MEDGVVFGRRVDEGPLDTGLQRPQPGSRLSLFRVYRVAMIMRIYSGFG